MHATKIRSLLRKLALSATAAAALSSTTAAWAISYQYDELGRVVKVTYDDGSIVEYTYDAAGNRVVVTGTD